MAARTKSSTKTENRGSEDLFLQKGQDLSKYTKDDSKTTVWWENIFHFIFFHAIFFLTLFKWRKFWETDWRNLVLAFVWEQLGTIGMSMGNHRLWSHRAFKASFTMRVILAICSSIAFQGSARFWAVSHRMHHRWTDTDYDPYDSRKGFWWAHCGWLFFKEHHPRRVLIDVSDLDNDKVVSFQHKHYTQLGIFFGSIVPAVIAWLGWGDFLGGLLYAGTVARVICWHSTFCINSLAHWLGEREYTIDISARGNLVVALATGGEGNHNFHHSFPRDYKNGLRPWDFDPSKWIIWGIHVAFPSLIPEVFETPKEEIDRAKAHVDGLIKHPEFEVSSLKTGATPFIGIKQISEEVPSSGSSSASLSSDNEDAPEVDNKSLPIWERDTLSASLSSFRKLYPTGRPLLLILDSYVVDVSTFFIEHPGGASLLLKRAIKFDDDGKPVEESIRDSQPDFEFLNNHQWAARRKVKDLRVAKVVN